MTAALDRLGPRVRNRARQPLGPGREHHPVAVAPNEQDGGADPLADERVAKLRHQPPAGGPDTGGVATGSEVACERLDDAGVDLPRLSVGEHAVDTADSLADHDLGKRD